MNDDRQAGSAKEVDHVKCGCDEYPECTHALYWYQGFKAGEEWARELLAKWMMESSFATGHGDTFVDLLNSQSRQIAELRKRREAPKP